MNVSSPWRIASAPDRARVVTWGAWAALAFIAAAMWWFRTDGLQLQLAWDGYSPELVITQFLHPEWFENDYPSGATELLKSAPVFFYLATAWVGLSAVAAMKLWIAAEIAVIAAAGFWFARRVLPDTGIVAAIVTAVLLIVGTYRGGDLGRFGEPYYGWVYTFAYAAIIVAIGALLQRRIVVSAVALAIAFVCHPVLSLLGGIFVATVFAVRWREFRWRAVIAATAAYLVIVCPWTAYVASTGTLGGGGIPSGVWVMLTRIESHHLYPVAQGLFWQRHFERLFPFLSALLMLEIYLPDAQGRFSGWRSAILVGCAALLLATIAGVGISEWMPAPFLIKLALYRASSILLIVSLLFAAPGIWHDATTGRSRVRAALAVLVIVSVFICPYGIPIAFAVALAGVVVIDDVRRRQPAARTWLLVSTCALAVCLLAVYAIAGVADWSNQQYWGLTGVPRARVAAIAALVAIVVLSKRGSIVAPVAVVGALAVLGILWARSTDNFIRYPEQRPKAADYLAAQQWADRNTPMRSLFMPDPTHYNGWRDYAHRPSFGNLREWLYAGWMYNSRKAALDAGLERTAVLGIEPGLFARLRGTPDEMEGEIERRVRARYYALSCEDLRDLERRFGIRYFVFDRQLRPAAPARCGTAYVNRHYLIVTTQT